MNDEVKDLLKELEGMTPEERKEILEHYHETQAGEEAIQGRVNVGMNHWHGGIPNAEEEQIVVQKIEEMLTEIMGPNSPYQFAMLSHMHNEYSKITDIHAPYARKMGRNQFRIYVRTYLEKGRFPGWQEKSQPRKNQIWFMYPNGAFSHQLTGFGKVTLTTSPPSGKEWVHIKNCVAMESIWNSAAFMLDHPANQGRV
jgi:hypothetical protein